RVDLSRLSSSDAVANLDDLADQAADVVVLAVDQRLDLGRHLAQLLLQGSAAGASDDGGDDGDQERTAPDLADGVAGRRCLDDVEPLGLEGAGDLFALGADLVDDKNG